jgi:hypothetical protein
MSSKGHLEFGKAAPRRFKDDSDIGPSSRTQSSFFKEDLERSTANRFLPRRDAHWQPRGQTYSRGGGFRGGYQPRKEFTDNRTH